MNEDEIEESLEDRRKDERSKIKKIASHKNDKYYIWLAFLSVGVILYLNATRPTKQISLIWIVVIIAILIFLLNLKNIYKGNLVTFEEAVRLGEERLCFGIQKGLYPKGNIEVGKYHHLSTENGEYRDWILSYEIYSDSSQAHYGLIRVDAWRPIVLQVKKTLFSYGGSGIPTKIVFPEWAKKELGLKKLYR